MSNQVTIQPTIFEDAGTVIRTYGVRIYDYYDCYYDNTWESIPDDDMEIFINCLRIDNDCVRAMFDFILEEEHGVIIGETWYDWNEIKEYFEGK